MEQLIIITTSSTIQNRQIKKYLGLVSARGWTATGFVTGDLSKEKNRDGYRDLILSTEENLRQEAKRIGANAVIRVEFHLDSRPAGTFLFAFGTAVVIE